MHEVAQKDNHGCGIACVSFILEKSYKNSKKLFDNPKSSKDYGFLCKDIVKALKKGGLDYEYKYIKPKIKKNIYKPKTIVFIKRSKKYPSGHYLVRTINKKWMDPWINFPSNIKNAKSGPRKRLPGKLIYTISSRI